MCFVCGKDNSRGLRLNFEHPEKGRLTATVVFSKEHQGFKGIVHGGMVAVVLDEMMVNLAWVEKTPAVTADFRLRLKKPCPTGETIRLEGLILKQTDKLIYAASTAKSVDGDLLASAEATCVRMKNAAPRNT
jgi:acyl-coenzyme A thioesterase PaaI-like protein